MEEDRPDLYKALDFFVAVTTYLTKAMTKIKGYFASVFTPKHDTYS